VEATGDGLEGNGRESRLISEKSSRERSLSRDCYLFIQTIITTEANVHLPFIPGIYDGASVSKLNEQNR